MRTETKTPALTYSPAPYHTMYGPLLRQPRGLEIMNLLFISRGFDKRGATDLSNPNLIKAVIGTLNSSMTTCEPRNPFEHDPAGNISALLLQPPELFAAWLNKLPMELMVKLPMHTLMGSEWLATVNQRLPLCNKHFDDVPDVSLAQAALAEFLR